MTAYRLLRFSADDYQLVLPISENRILKVGPSLQDREEFRITINQMNMSLLPNQ